MNRMTTGLVSTVLVILLAGCATSPKIQVVQPGDNNLSCSELAAQLEKLDWAESDVDTKKGVTGTNVASAIFWLPGLAYTYYDAGQAMEAINDRRSHLTSIYPVGRLPPRRSALASRSRVFCNQRASGQKPHATGRSNHPTGGGICTSLPVKPLARKSACARSMSASGQVYATTGRISPRSPQETRLSNTPSSWKAQPIRVRSRRYRVRSASGCGC